MLVIKLALELVISLTSDMRSDRVTFNTFKSKIALKSMKDQSFVVICLLQMCLFVDVCSGTGVRM